MGRFEVTGKVVVRELDDEAVMLDLDEGSFYVSRGTGMRVWQEATAGKDRDEIVAAITAEYEVDQATAGRDVDAFLGELVARGYLKAV